MGKRSEFVSFDSGRAGSFDCRGMEGWGEWGNGGMGGERMTTYRVGYFVGSLSKHSINRKLAGALVRSPRSESSARGQRQPDKESGDREKHPPEQ